MQYLRKGGCNSLTTPAPQPRERVPALMLGCPSGYTQYFLFNVKSITGLLSRY